MVFLGKKNVKDLINPLERDEFVEKLRKELFYLIEDNLSPIARRYSYNNIPLESKTSWKPIVLILGNDSSGKSTLINEFIGDKIQITSDSPIESAFTVVTCDNDEESYTHIPEGKVYEELSGQRVFNSEQYPFGLLGKYGDKFSSNFRLKKVRSKALKKIAIIDTPGMSTSFNESANDYDFQGVIHDLAILSDLIIVLFDHQELTSVYESHPGLEQILSNKTIDSRLLFVLNRIDKYSSLSELLDVYGSLCWNLSKMTEHRDTPRLLVTYSPSASLTKNEVEVKGFLSLLENQRCQLTSAIANAPKYRLDHLASFIEFHGIRLNHLLEELIFIKRNNLSFMFRLNSLVILFSLFIGSGVGYYAHIVRPFPFIDSENIAILLGLSFGLGFFLVVQFFSVSFFKRMKLRKLINSVEFDEDFVSQSKNETWSAIKPSILRILKRNQSIGSLVRLKRERNSISRVLKDGLHHLREEINRVKNID